MHMSTGCREATELPTVLLLQVSHQLFMKKMPSVVEVRKNIDVLLFSSDFIPLQIHSSNQQFKFQNKDPSQTAAVLRRNCLDFLRSSTFNKPFIIPFLDLCHIIEKHMVIFHKKYFKSQLKYLF